MKRMAFACLLLFYAHTGFAQDKTDIAIVTDDLRQLQLLMVPDSINNCGNTYTALSLAIKARSFQCFEWLLSKGADVNKACGKGKAPIFVAAKFGTLDMLKALEKHGADMKATYKGKTLMEYAKEEENTYFIKYLEGKK